MSTEFIKFWTKQEVERKASVDVFRAKRTRFAFVRSISTRSPRNRTAIFDVSRRPATRTEGTKVQPCCVYGYKRWSRAKPRVQSARVILSGRHNKRFSKVYPRRISWQEEAECSTMAKTVNRGSRASWSGCDDTCNNAQSRDISTLRRINNYLRSQGASGREIKFFIFISTRHKHRYIE